MNVAAIKKTNNNTSDLNQNAEISSKSVIILNSISTECEIDIELLAQSQKKIHFVIENLFGT